jgi:multiple sugar transport system substrate-binding protein
MRHKRSFANILIAVATVGSIALATNVNSGAAPARAAGTVSLATWSSNPTEQAGQKKLVAAFEAKYGLHVDFQVVNGDYSTVMKARFAAGTAPDVFYVNSDTFQDFASSGALMNLDFLQKVKSFGYNQYYKGLQTGYVYHKHVYGLVKDYSTLGLWYNKSMFSAAHISKPPTTWAQLKADACKLTNKASKVYGISLSTTPDRWAAFLQQAGGGSNGGGGLLNKQQTKAYLSGPAAINTVKFYAGLVQQGCAVYPSKIGAGWNGQAFGQANVAMAIEGNWLTSAMQQTYPTVSWGIAPLPKDKKGGNLAFTAAYGVYARTSNKANTLKLLEYLAGKAGTTVWSHVVGYLPARKDVKPPAGTKVFADQVKYAKDWFFPPGFSDRALTPIGNDMQKVMDGQMSVTDAVKDMQSQATKALTQVP